MKISQFLKKYKLKFLINIIILFCFLSVLLILPRIVYAQGLIQVIDEYVGGVITGQTNKGIAQQAKDWIKNWDKIDLQKALEKAAAIAYKKALSYFLNELAYNTATYLATGDKGQNPMFETNNIGDFLRKTADNAAGTFLETLGKENGYVKFNLCQPDIKIGIKIGLGLLKTQRPQKPACSFSTLVKNWDKQLSDPNFLPKFQDMFNPQSSDLGIALSLQTGIMETKNLEQSNKGLSYLTNQGIHAVVDPISGRIKTPSAAVKEQMGVTIQEGTSLYKVYTGDAVADAIDIFINTLSGKLIEEWLKKGLVTSFPNDEYNWDKLTNPEAQGGTGGLAGAKARFRSLVEPQFGSKADYNILAELTICSDPNKAGPTNCVIEEKLRQAIENKLTVGEALKQGYFNANGVFGFTSDGLEPRFNEGYSYRSMIILRKYRIIPNGWEVAAQYIKDNPSGIDGTKNISDLVNCYSDTDDYAGYYASWCRGLVDPSWVLKAPLNFCKRQGAGPEIMSEQVTGTGADSALSISRNDSYCADEQSCIKEANDGSCSLYGYCTEEKRKWDFNAKACEPRNNTCQTFRNTDGGQTVSYLENTLDYGACSASNVGCKAYCQDYDFTAGAFSCTLTTGNKIYLNKNADTCTEAGEGCHEFIRTKGGVGANFLANSSFEDSLTGGLWDGNGTQVSDAFSGTNGLQLNGSINENITVGPAGYSVAGEPYTFSFYAKNCGLSDSFEISGQAATTVLNQGANWQRYVTTYIFPITATGNIVGLAINSGACIIDDIKLERGSAATAYSDYREGGLVYEKLAPSYLNCDGSSDPDQCSGFVRTCQASEVGCELYTGSDNISIPAKVMAQDYCPAECVGYDTYIQAETAFDSARQAYFIPKTAKACGAAGAGCDQFTNLDEVARGGEGIEYYSYLRQCIKPDQTQCSEYYTWEGSDETGYQLKVNGLKTNLANGEPDLTEDDSLECSAAIYSLPPTDPGYNSDCRQFYSRTGQLSYHLYRRTVSCDNNCHPYRRTAINIDPNITGAGSCNGPEMHWDGATSQCVVCKSSGVWDSQHGACIYQAVPGQGQTCAATQNGCRDYSGNTGNNVRFVINSDFESGSADGWSGQGGTTASVSNESLIVGGHSLGISGGNFSLAQTVGQNVQRGKAYVITFIAKGRTAATNGLNSVRLVNATGEEAFFTVTSLDSDWQIYKVNLANLDHNPSSDESLILTANGDFYIDDIRLTEITDRHYLIKDSWTTPASCDEDIEGNPSPLYMLGCDSYHDRENRLVNLHNFTSLCQDSAVGCELMIDTQNSSEVNSAVYNAGDPSEITVPADSFTYAVFDKNKQCSDADKGCAYLGLPYQYGSDLLYSGVYLKNDPDKYNESLCLANAAGCQEWTSNETTSYFKDPGDTVCEWRQGVGLATNSWDWFQKKIKRCGGNAGAVCLTDNDCTAPDKCVLETSDIACPAKTYYKTFGYGGQGNLVIQPAITSAGVNWAGTCAASDSGCSEYLDPLSKFSANLIFNSNFSQNFDHADSPDLPDGWRSYVQEVAIESNTLYRLARTGSAGSLSAAFNQTVRQLGSDNNLLTPVNTLALTAEANENSIIFYSDSATNCNITVGGFTGEVELKKIVVDYQLAQGLDKESCNGVVDFEQGCVLFNERKQNGRFLSSLTWDADLTYDDANGKQPEVGVLADRDANTIIKVNPDRVCDKWLACRSYIKDEKNNNVCFDIGLCNSIDANGNCNSFIIPNAANPVNQVYPAPLDAGKISNYSGYNKVGYNLGNSLNSDYYPLAEMKQLGEIANLPNGGFEFAGANGYPVGWSPEFGHCQTNFNLLCRTDADCGGTTCLVNTWQESVFKVIDDPIEAQTEGITYAREGNNFLKLGSTFSATSEFIDVVGGTPPAAGVPYVLTAYINTLNLKSGSAQVMMEGFDTTGNYLGVLSAAPAVTLSAGNDWTFKLGKFNISNPNISRIKVTLYSDSATQGNFYFDDIKIRPGLETKCLSGMSCAASDNIWFTPQTCRLYPQADSLSCDYFDDSGKEQKGMYGYCLEYDRYPGSSDACLLWWPVDKVKGEGIEEGAGYNDKFPLYYCLEATPYCDAGTAKYYCNRLVQTVTATGQSKYWSGKVYQGSDFEIPFATSNSGRFINWSAVNHGLENIVLNYSRHDKPFGSMVPPYPVVNPYEWDAVANTETNINIEPIPLLPPGTRDAGKISAGTPYYGSNMTCSNPYWYGHGNCEQNCGCANGSFAICDSGSCGIANLGVWDNCVITGGEVAGTANIYQNPADYRWYVFVLDGCGNTPSDYVNIICTTNMNYNIAADANEARNGVRDIFAQSYGVWSWNGNQTNGRYIKISASDWGPPDTTCPGNSRPAYPNDYCAIPPAVTFIKVNNSNSINIELTKNQFINLTFNSNVNSQELPMVMYAVDWGDAEQTVVSGVEMRNRSNQENPHSLYHLYSYWDIKAKTSNGSVPANQCGTNCQADGYCTGYIGAYCRVQPRVRIKDNWGWCNGGTSLNDCDQWEPFTRQVIIKEK